MNERLFDKIMKTSRTFCGVTVRYVDVLFIFCIWICAFLIRSSLMPLLSGDFYYSFDIWMNEIRDGGLAYSLCYGSSDYPTAYMYLMALITKLTPDNLTGIKYLSFFFEYLASIAIFLIIYNKTKSLKKATLSMGLLLVSPTVILDSAIWCQCDIIYSCFILFAIYELFKDRSALCFLFLGVAFAFKLQTAFILPFIVIMWLKKYSVKIRHIFIIPIVYALFQVPAFFLGKSISDILSIYSDQTNMYPWGTLNYPNIYYFLDETINNNHHMTEISGSGLFLSFALLGIFAYYIYVTEFKMTKEISLYIALFTIALAIFTLPHMHDRYSFLVDILAIIIAVANPKRIYLACTYGLISVFTYMPFLIGVEVIELKYVAIANAIILVHVAYLLFKLIEENKCEPTVILAINEDTIDSIDINNNLDTENNSKEEDNENVEEE